MCIACSMAAAGSGAAAPGAAGSEFRFTRADFGPLTFAPLHYELVVDVPVGPAPVVTVTARQTYRLCADLTAPVSELVLDAHDVELLAVEVLAPHTPLGPPPCAARPALPDFVAHVRELDTLAATPAAFAYDRALRRVTVQLGRAVAPGDEIVVRLQSTCTPNAATLEGIYIDATPVDAPPTLITQCQQYGFQRICPSTDSMLAKTFWTTTLVADARYTSMLSNGDLAPAHQPPASASASASAGAVFLPVEGGQRQRVTYYNHTVNMATYLFFLGLGTYEVHRRACEYPDGRVVDLELLALPGVVSRPADAAAALQSLHDSVLWVHVHTGPDCGQHLDAKASIDALLAEREQLKALEADVATSERLAQVRAELKRLVTETFAGSAPGHAYSARVYREIAMQNSNYGGMENTHNTTILSSRLTPSPWLADPAYIYMMGVKVHEFYHDLNGSRVTGSSPFELWLNEAVTVFMERSRMYSLFTFDFIRVGQVVYAQTPGSGPLAQDRSSVAMAVEPAGFNTTHELISAMTYSKAPEIVRGVQLLLGTSAFHRGLHAYHTRYAFGNATSDDWVACMAREAPAHVDLARYARGWLRRSGHPTVTLAAQHYDASAQMLTLTLQQSGFERHADSAEPGPWVVPLDWAVLGPSTGPAGSTAPVLAEGLFVLDAAAATLVVPNVPVEPAFVSLGRGFSFFGEVVNAAATPAQLAQQALADPDAVNRYLAWQRMLDDEKARLVEALRTGAAALVRVSPAVVAVFGAILADGALGPGMRGRLLDVTAAITSRPDLGHYYGHLAAARTAILQAAFAAHGVALRETYDTVAAASQAPGVTQNDTIGLRVLKFACFSALRAGLATASVLPDSPPPPSDGGATVAALLQGLVESEFMSDRAFALTQLLELGGATASAAQAAAKATWTVHPIGCEAYISCVAAADSEDTPRLVRELFEEPFFNVALAGHARGAARAYLNNRKRALLTREGLDLTVELFLRIGKVNQMSAYGFLSAFDDVNKFDPPVKAALVEALHAMRNGLDPKEQESLFNQLSRLLKDA